MASILGTLGVKLEALTKQFQLDIGAAGQALDSFSGTAAKVGIAAGAAFAGGAAVIGKSISLASDFDEQMNVIRVGFGDLTDATLAWADGSAQAVGRSRADMLQFAGSVQAILAPMLGATTATASMSRGLAGLAVDLGSFFNVADSDAMTALQSGIVGNVEPLRRFGIVLTQANLAAFALRSGITKSVDQLSEAEKVQLRYNFIVEQTKLAQGDAARTADSLANVMKRIQGQFKDAGIQLGQIFLPAAQKVAAIISNIIGFFTALSPATQKMAAGILLAGTAVAGLGAAFAAFLAVLPSIIAGFVAFKAVAITAFLPLIPVVLGVVGAIGGVIIALGIARRVWKEQTAGMTNVWQNFTFEVKNLAKAAFDGVLKGIKALASGAVQLFGFITGDADATFERLQAIEKFDPSAALDAAIDKTNDLADSAKDVAVTFGRDVKNAFLGGLETIKDGLQLVGVDVDGLVAKVKMLPDALGKVQVGGGFTAPSAVAVTGGPGGGGLGGAGLGGMATTSIQESAAQFASGFAEVMGEAKQTITQSVQGAVGEIGDAAAQGFQAGGIIGALVAVVATIASKLQSIQQSTDIVNKDLEFLFSALSELFEPLRALTEVLSSIIRPIFKALGSVFKALAGPLTGVMKAFKPLGKLFQVFGQLIQSFANVLKPLSQSFGLAGLIVEGLSRVIKFFVNIISKVVNFVIKIINGVAKLFGKSIKKFNVEADEGASAVERFTVEIEKATVKSKEFVARFADGSSAVVNLGTEVNSVGGNLGEAAKRLIALGLSGKQLEDALAALGAHFDAESTEIRDAGVAREIQGAVDPLVDNLGNLNDGVQELTDQMLDAPTGFKSALRRFQAIQVGEMGGGPGADFALAETDRGGRIVIETMNVDTTDATGFASLLKDADEFGNFVKTGTSQKTGAPFSVDQKGA